MNAIVIPTYNERENIGPLIGEILQVIPNIKIVVIDDDSADGTADAVRKLQKEHSQIDLIVRKKDTGRGGACLAGFQYVLKNYPQVSYVVEMDADFSHAPRDIPRLLKKASLKTIVIGSRYVSGSQILEWPRYRLVLSVIANWYIRLVLGIPIADYTMGFRCYSREALQAIDFGKVHYKGFITLSEVAYLLKKKGFKFVEIPITLKDRTRGKSHATFGEVFKSFAAIFHIRFLH